MDVCKGGCAGIWFDNFELKKFDEPLETSGEELLNIERAPGLNLDTSSRRKCPKCKNLTMMQHLFSPSDNVMIDECPGCAGIWLDPGELATIRSRFSSEVERNAETDRVLSKEIAPTLTRLKAQSDLEHEKIRRFANMFRFICPSYYIPGKQDWGAF